MDNLSFIEVMIDKSVFYNFSLYYCYGSFFDFVSMKDYDIIPTLKCLLSEFGIKIKTIRKIDDHIYMLYFYLINYNDHDELFLSCMSNIDIDLEL